MGGDFVGCGPAGFEGGLRDDFGIAGGRIAEGFACSMPKSLSLSCWR